MYVGQRAFDFWRARALKAQSVAWSSETLLGATGMPLGRRWYIACSSPDSFTTASNSSAASAQVSIARRLVKEVAHYEAETIKDKGRVEALRADPAKDEWDVKKMLEVVEESQMMIPDATRRLGEAINELFSFMEEHHETKEVLECEWFAEATALLEKYDDMVTD